MKLTLARSILATVSFLPLILLVLVGAVVPDRVHAQELRELALLEGPDRLKRLIDGANGVTSAHEMDDLFPKGWGIPRWPLYLVPESSEIIVTFS